MKIDDIFEQELLELKTNSLTKAVDLFVLSRPSLRFRQTKLDFDLVLPNGESLEVWTYKKDTTIVTAWTKSNQLAVQVALIGKTLLGSPVYTVLYADVDRRYQGNKLAISLYRKMIGDGATICASDSHSDGAQKMWNRLASESAIASFGYDSTNKKAFALEPSEDGLVVKGTNESIYDTDYWAIVTKKGGTLANSLSANLAA